MSSTHHPDGARRARGRRPGGLLAVAGACAVAAAAVASYQHLANGSSDALTLGAVPAAENLDGTAPAAVDIPAIAVSAGVDPLAVQPNGKVQVPKDYARVGWYAPGAAPGETGSAVLLGHVDSRVGPAVFFRLKQLTPGDEVRVTRRDGMVVRFVVERVEQRRKERFPTAAVYGRSPEPTLALVTCAGPYEGHYRDNLIVFARRVG